MNRIMIVVTACLVVVAGMSVSQEAEAGLFNRNKCCKPQRCRQSRRANKCCQPTCCQPAPTCCEPKPCCEPQPCCQAAAPAPCGCEAAPACGCQTVSCECLGRRGLRRAQRKGQCCGVEYNKCNSCCSAPVSTCGCSAPAGAPCGCSGATDAPTEAAPEAPQAEPTA